MGGGKNGQAELPRFRTQPPNGDRVPGFELPGVAREDRLLSLLFIWSVLFIWLNQIDQRNQMGQTDRG
jgi:hypothetical protein